MAVLEASYHYWSYRLRLMWQGNGEDIYTYLCSAGKQGSGADYIPAIVHMGDINSDNAGFTRGMVTVDLHQTIRAFHDVAAGGDWWESFETLAALFEKYPPMHAATATIERYANDGGTSEWPTIFTGRIVRLAHVGNATATFELEQRSHLQYIDIPRNTVKAAWFNTKTEQDKIPETSRGLVLPLSGGEFLPYHALTNVNADTARGLGSWGLRSVGIPALEVYRDAGYRYFAFEESIAGFGLKLESDVVTRGRSAYVYISELDTWALVYTGGVTIFDTYTSPWPANPVAWRVKLAAEQWVRVPVRPRTVHSWTTGGVVNAERAIDGKLDTWATLPPGASLICEIPSVSPIGRISGNGVDEGGTAYDGEYETHAPAGLEVGVALHRPTGGDTANGNVEFGVIFPVSPIEYLFGVSGTVLPPTGDGHLLTDSVALPWYQGPGTPGTRCFAGTKFCTWDFTTGPDGTTGAPDAPLHHASADGKAWPFLLQIKNNSTVGNVYPMSLVLRVGCKLGTEAWRPAVALGKKITFVDVTGRRHKKTIEQTQIYGDEGELEGNMAGAFNGLGPGNNGQLQPRPTAAPKWDSDVMVTSDTLIDDTSGHFTGTASARLLTPVEWARYFLRVYRNFAETSFVADDAFGGWSNARALLTKWMGYAGAGSTRWQEQFTLREQMNTEEALASIMAHVPGGQVLKTRTGTWRCHVWVPELCTDLYVSMWRNPGSGSDYARPLSFAEILPAADGPNLAFESGDIDGVYNSFEVAYDADPNGSQTTRTATCDYSKSDDGYGTAWPACPVTAIGAAALCSWSRAKFGGVTRKCPQIVVPGVRDPHVAVAIGLGAMWRSYREPRMFRAECTPAAADLQPGHIFRLSNDLETDGGYPVSLLFPWASQWEDIYWICASAQEVEDERTGKLRFAVRAQWCPTEIGTEAVGQGFGLPLGEQGDLG